MRRPTGQSNWRAAPRPEGQGSVPQMQGAGRAVRSNGPGWSPTVGNLVVLLALEVAAYLTLRWAFRTAHGG